MAEPSSVSFQGRGFSDQEICWVRVSRGTQSEQQMQVNSQIGSLGVRWTIGDVSEAGFEALRVSICSAHRLFGDQARYAVCVNRLAAASAADRVGRTPCAVRWMQCEEHVPEWLTRHVDPNMAEGVAWKLAPVRVFPDIHELSLDNDVILWRIPTTMRRWLASENAVLLASDVRPAFGQFSDRCGERALNSGIRGLPPGFDLEARMESLLTRTKIHLQSELDEQGLQSAILCGHSRFLVVPTKDVSICSPFPMHQRGFGRCGAHFVGLNPKTLPWILEGRGAHEVIREFWRSRTAQLEDVVYGAERGELAV